MSDVNQLTEAIIGAAIEVHKRLGPGLLESAYRICLAYELRRRGFKVVEEKPVPVITTMSNWNVAFEQTWLSTIKSLSNSKQNRRSTRSTKHRSCLICGC